MIPHAAMPQAGGQYMQQASIFPPKTPLQFTPQQVQELQQQQQQQQLHHHPQMMPFQGHMVMRPVGPMNEIHAAPQTQSSHGGGGGSGSEPPQGGTGMSEPQRGSTLSSTADVRGSKSDAGSAASKHAAAAADGQKNSASEQRSGDVEAGPNPKRPESSKNP